MIHEKDALLDTSPTPSRVFNTLDDPPILLIISLSQILKQFKVNIYTVIPRGSQIPHKMTDLISLDKHLRIWAPEPPVSNLPAKLGSSPSLAYSIGSPRRQSMTQALSPTSLPIQGGSLTNQVSDDAFVISPENQGKDSHGCGIYTGNKDMANTSLLHSDIGKLCSNNKYSLFKPEIIMSIGDKKSNETAGKQF